jgi:hypothetical protein
MALPDPNRPRSGGKLQLPNIFQNLPEGWLRGATHGSICIQEGQPIEHVKKSRTRRECGLMHAPRLT